MLLYATPDPIAWVYGIKNGCSTSGWRDGWAIDPAYDTPDNAVWTGDSVALIARAGNHFGVVGIDQKAQSALGGAWASSVVVEYDMMFDPAWGLIETDDEGKLIGIYSTAEGEDDADGGVPANGENGFSVRTMFRAEAAGIIPMCCYVYHVDQAGQYGDKFDWQQSGGGMIRGAWYRVRIYCRINDGSDANGVVAVWVNNQPVLRRGNLRYRTDAIALHGIERVRLQLYWGGANTPDSDSAVHVKNFSVKWSL